MGSGGGGGGRGSGRGGGRAGIPSGKASNGETHVVAGTRYNTGAIVDSALGSARVTRADKEATIERLRAAGNRNPETDKRIPRLSAERAVLRELQTRIPGSNLLNQWGNGRWDISSANSVTTSLNNYLGRRTSGIRSRWNSASRR